MADVSVNRQVNSQGKTVGVVANLSDELNNSLTIVGIPNVVYNLAQMAGEVQGADIVATDVVTSLDANTNALIVTGLGTSQDTKYISITDTVGSSVGILGNPNTTYDLNLLTYLLAVVSAQDMFLTMQFGDDYLQAKNEFLQRANLA